MTNIDSDVEQIVRSLSFEVVAVPTQRAIQSSTSKSTPLNVRIKVKKKVDGGLQHGILATPTTLGPDGIPQRVRLVSSDHTIMSFDVVMEDADFKPVSSRKPVIPKLPINPGAHDSTYNQTSNQNYKIDVKESRTSQSEGSLKNNAKDNKTSPKVHKKDIFGKCKPGGCLDPPFGEDKYSYQPTQESLQNNQQSQENVNTTKPRTSSILSNRLFKKTKKTKPKKSSAKPDEQDSLLSLYHGDSLQSMTLSNSLITYPSTLDENDIKLLQEKQKLAVKNYESISKKSIDINSGSLYIIPKKNKISAELKDLPIKEKDTKPDQNLTQVDIIPINVDDANLKQLQEITTTDPDSHQKLELKYKDQKVDDEVQNNSMKMLRTGDSIDESDSAKRFQPYKEVSETYGTNEDPSLQNLLPTVQYSKGVVVSDVMSSGDLPMVIAKKERLEELEEPAGVADRMLQEKLSSSDELIQNKDEHTAPISTFSESNMKESYPNESGILKEETDKTTLSKSIDDGIENFMPTGDTEKNKILSPKNFVEGNAFDRDADSTINVPQTTTEDLIDSKIEKAPGGNTTERTDISSDILEEPSYPGRNKIMHLKGKGLEEQFRNDDIDNQDQTRSLSESDQILESDTKSVDLKTSILNSIGTVEVDLQSNWEDGKESIDFKITIDNCGMENNKDKDDENDTTAEKLDKRISAKHVGVGDEMLKENLALSDVLTQNKNEHTAPISTESDTRDPFLNDSATMKEETNKITQELIQDRNMHDPLNDDSDDTLKTKNDSHNLNIDASPKGQSKTDTNSIVDSTPKDTSNGDYDYLNDEKINGNKESDTMRKENYDKQSFARNNDTLSNERQKPIFVNESDSKMDPYVEYGRSDKKNNLFSKKNQEPDNGSKRSKTSESFDNMVSDITEINKLKNIRETEKPVKIDIGLHSYTTDNNEVIIKSFDSQTVLERHPKDAIIMASCNLRDPFELKVPIDNDNLMWIQIKNKSKDDSDTRKPNNSKSALKAIKEGANINDATKLSEVYEKFLENELYPLQDTIKRLKQEVDVLIYQQNTLKENLISKRMKQFKLVQNKRCCFCRKL